MKLVNCAWCELSTPKISLLSHFQFLLNLYLFVASFDLIKLANMKLVKYIGVLKSEDQEIFLYQYFFL